MAIKLADVIQRNNAEYPIVEAQAQTVLGFYNGVAGDAQQALELYYDGESKSEFAVANSSGNGAKFLKLPYLSTAGTDESTVGAGDARALLSVEGGVFVTKDSKLYTDAGGNDTLASVYVHNVLSAGNTPADNSARASLERASELVQQFNRYETLEVIDDTDSTVTVSSILEDGEKFWLAGYDAERKRMRKLAIQDLIGVIGTTIGNELVDGGIITSTNSGGSGAIGDLNGDGEVGISDVLILLGAFGSNPNLNYVSLFRMLTDDGDNISLTPTAGPNYTGSGTGGAFQWGDLETFPFNLNYGTNNAVHGWESFSAPVNSAEDNYVLLTNRAQSNTADQWYAGKALRAMVTAKVQGPFADFVIMWIRVRLITTNGEKYEQVYYMRVEDATSSEYFWYGNDLGSSPGQGVTVSWFYRSGNETSNTALDYEPTDTGVNTSNLMQSNLWDLNSTAGDLAGDAGVQKLDDVEVRFGIYSYTGLTSVVISMIHVYVDEEPSMFYAHPE